MNTERQKKLNELFANLKHGIQLIPTDRITDPSSVQDAVSLIAYALTQALCLHTEVSLQNSAHSTRYFLYSSNLPNRDGNPEVMLRNKRLPEIEMFCQALKRIEKRQTKSYSVSLGKRTIDPNQYPDEKILRTQLALLLDSNSKGLNSITDQTVPGSQHAIISAGIRRTFMPEQTPQETTKLLVDLKKLLDELTPIIFGL